MEALKRILIFIAVACFVFLIVSVALSIFIIFWPILVIGLAASAIYIAIRNKFGPPPNGPGSSYRREQKTTIIIEHKPDDTKED